LSSSQSATQLGAPHPKKLGGQASPDAQYMTKLSTAEIRTFELGNNPHTWSKSSVTPQNRYIMKQRFSDLILKYGQDKFKPNAFSQMKRKYTELLTTVSL
jgi:hypothetical protein